MRRGRNLEGQPLFSLANFNFFLCVFSFLRFKAEGRGYRVTARERGGGEGDNIHRQLYGWLNIGKNMYRHIDGYDRQTHRWTD